MIEKQRIGHNSGDLHSSLNFNYFTLEYAIKEHDQIIDKSGGRHGIKDIGMVDSVLEHMQNDLYYPTFLDKVTHLVYGLNKNHAFTDGNKRSSLALSAFFLELNDHGTSLAQYQRGMEEVLIWVAKSLISKDKLKDIIEFLIYDRPMNVAWFVCQAKKYRPFIEPENQPITATLLSKMIDSWIDENISLSEKENLSLLEAILA